MSERTPTDVLVEQARERSFYGEVRGDISTRDLLTALADRLAELAAENERLRAELEASRG